MVIMFKKFIYIIIIILIYLFICNVIYNSSITTKSIYINKKAINSLIPIYKEKPIGKIIIKRINIENNLYNINSKHNNVEENVTILKESVFPNNDNSIMFIAAHSGTGEKAYFKDLNKLKINDEIIIIINDNIYKYMVTEIREDNKDGYINIDKIYEKQLVLTTCSPLHDNKQLIINSKIKESIN